MPSTDSSNKTSVLKTAREAKNLTLEIVHEATKIPMDVLKAIEEGYSVRTITPFYYRGFIKIYAEFLDLNVAETYKHYNLERPKPMPAVVPPAQTSHHKVLPSQVVLHGRPDFLSVLFKPRYIKRILKIFGVLAVLFLAFRIGGCMVSYFHKKGPVLSRRVTSRERVEYPSRALPVVKHEAILAKREDHTVEVAVRAVRDTWLQVKSDDRVVFQMTLSKGSVESWSAKSRIELAGRNIGQLDMEINGKHIGSLQQAAGRRIRRVLITPEGLTVKR